MCRNRRLQNLPKWTLQNPLKRNPPNRPRPLINRNRLRRLNQNRPNRKYPDRLKNRPLHNVDDIPLDDQWGSMPFFTWFRRRWMNGGRGFRPLPPGLVLVFMVGLPIGAEACRLLPNSPENEKVFHVHLEGPC